MPLNALGQSKPGKLQAVIFIWKRPIETGTLPLVESQTSVVLFTVDAMPALSRFAIAEATIALLPKHVFCKFATDAGLPLFATTWQAVLPPLPLAVVPLPGGTVPEPPASPTFEVGVMVRDALP